MKFYKMQHRETLQEALKTKIEIDEGQFTSYLSMKDKRNNVPIFQYYCYDERIKCYRFINYDMCYFNNLPTWLLWER